MCKPGWPKELDEQLLHLRNEKQMKWHEIGAIVGKSKTACHHRYTTLVPSLNRVKIDRRSWSDENKIELSRLRFIEQKTVAQIAVMLNRTILAVASKLQQIGRYSPGQTLPCGLVVKSKAIPDDVLQDRERRMAVERDLTATFFGDPRPGQSALDRREACCEQA